MMTKAIILDTETSGLPPLGEACEIAFFEIDFKRSLEQARYKVDAKKYSALTIQDMEYGALAFHQTFMPKGDFSPKASEVNGFTKENLKGSPCISTFKFPTDVTYLIGHNIMFDWQMVTKPDVKLICTKELAIKYLTKQSGAGTKGVNTLTGLIERYYPEEAKELITNAHSALQDCKLCYLILLKILEVAPELDSFEKLIEQCTQPCGSKHGVKLPRLIQQDSYTKEHKLTFGKYTLVSLETLIKTDKNYLVWIVEKSNMPQDLKDFVKQFMKNNK
jgi:exodeoxyribonuclease X